MLSIVLIAVIAATGPFTAFTAGGIVFLILVAATAVWLLRHITPPAGPRAGAGGGSRRFT